MTTAAEEARYAALQVHALDLARAGETAALAPLLAAGLAVNLADHQGQTLLMLASYHGRLDTARLLLEHGAEVDRRNDRGQTPLGGVAFKGYLELATLLLDHGAALMADQGSGQTPLQFARMFGRHEMVALLEARAAI